MKKRNIFPFFFTMLLPLFLASCTVKEESTGIEESTTIEESNPSTSIVDTSDTYLSYKVKAPTFDVPKRASIDEVTYKDLFNLGNKVAIEIDMEDSELIKLEEDYALFHDKGIKSEIYRHCRSVTITLTNYDNTFSWTIEDVGIRQKGNTSRSTVFKDGKIAGLNHFKLSFDETFDDEAYGEDRYDWSKDLEGYTSRKNREFLGLSGLDLRWNKECDSTHIREIYASYMYQASGLISQHVGLTSFKIHQVDQNLDYNMGLYFLYEPATKSMIKRHLKDEDILNFGSWSDEKSGTFGVPQAKYGDLYKMKWGGDLSIESMASVGVASGEYSPMYDRKTNTDVEYDDHLLRMAGIACSLGNSANIGDTIDLEYFAKTEAVSWFLGNPDDYRNNMNNTMLYFRRSDGKGITIPIDNDRVFGLTKDWNPTESALTLRGIFNIYRAGNYENPVSSLYSKTILADTTNEAKLIYLNQIKAISISDWVKVETFQKYYLMALTTYSDAVYSDFWYVDFQTNNSYNQYSFSEYITKKRKLVDLSLNLGEAVEEERLLLPALEDLDGYYGRLYIAGDMNDWKGTAFEMEYLGDGIYTIDLTPGIRKDRIWLKIYDGAYWRINWSIKDGSLLMYDTDAFYVDNVGIKATFRITINTLTKEASINRVYD